MADGVLLDTSFLICFADPAQRGHATARQYLEFFAKEGVLMYLSTIVASEFHLGQSVQDLPLDAFQILPFNLRAAMAAAELEKKRVPEPDPATSRSALKDDMKLLGQAKVAGIAYVITDDESSLFKWCERLRLAHELETRAIKLSGGFDRSYFDPVRQHHLPFGESSAQQILPSSGKVSRRLILPNPPAPPNAT